MLNLNKKYIYRQIQATKTHLKLFRLIGGQTNRNITKNRCVDRLDGRHLKAHESAFEYREEKGHSREDKGTIPCSFF